MSQVSRSIKCVLVGDVIVGKTYMGITYTTGALPYQDVPTTYDSHFALVTVDGIQVQLELYDTSGNEEYDRIRPVFYAQTDVFLVCFSIMSPSSFRDVSNKWIPEVRHHRPDAPVILVGTKLDLREDRECLAKLADKGLSPITWEQGQELAITINAHRYFECSALTQQGLKRIFDEVVRCVIDPAPRQKKKKKKEACALL